MPGSSIVGVAELPKRRFPPGLATAWVTAVGPGTTAPGAPPGPHASAKTAIIPNSGSNLKRNSIFIFFSFGLWKDYVAHPVMRSYPNADCPAWSTSASVQGKISTSFPYRCHCSIDWLQQECEMGSQVVREVQPAALWASVQYRALDCPSADYSGRTGQQLTGCLEEMLGAMWLSSRYSCKDT
jgi:hypothetical protein